MPTKSAYLWGAGLTVAAVAAMAWSAVRPGEGVGAAAVLWAEDAWRASADWYQSGPGDRRPDWETSALYVVNADPDRGAALMTQYGCGACHVIPGVTAARGSVGPSLDGFADRAYVAGVLPNQPGDLVRWLMNPTTHAPQTAMPDLGVREGEARDMAAYLYTLGGG